MDLGEFLLSGGIGFVGVLSMIQIAPIKINPWSVIARAVGDAMNVGVMDRLDMHEAETSRYRIFRFDDEIRHGVKHSEEHFNQIITDIKKYENYCDTHPHFENDKAVFAIENIRRIYRKCREEKSFLI